MNDQEVASLLAAAAYYNTNRNQINPYSAMVTFELDNKSSLLVSKMYPLSTLKDLIGRKVLNMVGLSKNDG